MNHESVVQNTSRLWQSLAGTSEHLEQLRCSGPEQIYPSVFDVTAFATASIGVASLAAAELMAARRGKTGLSLVEVDSLEACAAFKSEGLLVPEGWQLPALWDPIAGDYRAHDRWIRLHTNYQRHREAVLDVLQVAPEREAVARAVAARMAADLEMAVVHQRGGCAAAMYSRDEWAVHTAGQTTLEEVPVSIASDGAGAPRFGEINEMQSALTGIRVLDLTRVIAGPECTRFLSAHGADVLRLDPVGFEEVPALLPDTTVGKRCAELDLASQDGKMKFESLLQQAHVLVLGYRANALDRHGLSLESIRQLNPSLIIATINAYGWRGSWSKRRGFDSLVQMSSGIAHRGSQTKNIDKPTPLPVQALDHGGGFLLAAGVCRALALQWKMKKSFQVRSSLIGVANFLISGPEGDMQLPSPSAEVFSSALVEDRTEWGVLRRVRCPGKIAGARPEWTIPAGPLGRSRAEFSL